MVDFILTFQVALKYSILNETNPLYILSGSLWPLLAVKLLVIAFFSWFFIWRYEKAHIVARYCAVAVVFVATVMQVLMAIQANAIYNLPEEQVVEIPSDQRQEYYITYVAAPILNSYFWLFFVFITWRILEGDYGRK